MAATLAVFVLGTIFLHNHRQPENTAAHAGEADPAAVDAEQQPLDEAAYSGAAEATAASADWQSPLTWEGLLAEPNFADDGTPSPAGAQLLASRFYEMEIDDQGRIIAARMPANEHSRRFGPAMEEIEALAELPHLRRLDLGDTIASAAVPIANRHPNLKVLVLENQTDADALKRLRGVEELHLINSNIDCDELAANGIQVVERATR